MLDLTIGLLRKSCLLRESCLGWEGRLLEAAAEAGGKTVGSRSPEPRRHAHGCGAKGRRWQEKRQADHLQTKDRFSYTHTQHYETDIIYLKNSTMYFKFQNSQQT